MTIYERLFGTPERAALALDVLGLFNSQIDTCYLMDAFGSDMEVKCANCFLRNCDKYGCERKDMSIAEWLAQEVSE